MSFGILRWFSLKIAQHRLHSESRHLRQAALEVLRSIDNPSANASLTIALKESRFPDVHFQALKILLERKKISYKRINEECDQLIVQLPSLDRDEVADASSILDDVKPGWDQTRASQAVFLECLYDGKLPKSLMVCIQHRLNPNSIVGFIPRLKNLESSRLSSVVSFLTLINPSWPETEDAQRALSSLLFEFGISDESLKVIQPYVTQEAAASEAVRLIITSERTEMVESLVSHIDRIGLSLPESSVKQCVPSLVIKELPAITLLASLFDRIDLGWHHDHESQKILANCLFADDAANVKVTIAGRVNQDNAARAAFNVTGSERSLSEVFARLARLDELDINWRKSQICWKFVEKMVGLGVLSHGILGLIDELNSIPEMKLLMSLFVLSKEKQKYKLWSRCRSLLRKSDTSHLISIGNNPVFDAALRETALNIGNDRSNLTDEEKTAIESMAVDASEDKYVRAAAMKWAGSFSQSEVVFQRVSECLAESVAEPLISAAIQFVRRSNVIQAFSLLLEIVRRDRVSTHVRHEACKTLIQIDPDRAKDELRFIVKDTVYSRLWPYLGQLLERTGELVSNDGPSLSLRHSLASWRKSVASATVHSEFEKLCDGLRQESDLSKVAMQEAIRQTACDAGIDLIDILEYYEGNLTYRRRLGVEIDTGTIARNWAIGEFWRGPEY